MLLQQAIETQESASEVLEQTEEVPAEVEIGTEVTEEPVVE
jgi:hypothetical protein